MDIQAIDNAGEGSSAEIKLKNTPKCRHHRSLVRPPKSDIKFVQIMLNFIHPVLVASGKFRICYFTYGVLDHYVMSKAERILEWCVPDLSPHKAEKRHRAMTRPLPWLFILPTLIAIRMLRFNLTFVSVMFKNGEITTTDLMNLLKGFRRYIRGIRCNASKQKEAAELEIEMERRKYVLWRAFYGIKDLIFVNSAASVCSNKNHDDHEHTRKRLLSSDGSGADSDEELNVNELLDKYAIKSVPDDEENDPTYQPEEDQVSSSDSISDTSVDHLETEKLKEDAEKDVSELVAEEVINEICANGIFSGKKVNGDDTQILNGDDSHKTNGDISPKLNGHNAQMNGDNAHVNGDNAHVNGDNVHVNGDNAHVNGDNAHVNENGSPKQNGHQNPSDMSENNHKENGTPTEESHQNQNGHHNDDSPSASIDSPHTRSKTKAAKKSSNMHHKRQQFQKYKAQSLVEKNRNKFLKRQNSSPIPTIVVTEH